MIYRAPMRGRVHEALAAGVVGIGEAEGRRLHRFAEVPEGAFVWTREPEGAYRLGRITGDLRRDDALVHARPADWLARAFGDNEVPSAVAATFARGGRNFQRTHDEAAERETAALWERYGA